jgi:tetratricopeptide (TPR) repeat protein
MTEEGFTLLQESFDLAQGAGDSWIASQVLKEYARCELEAGVHQLGLLHTEQALAICRQMGLGDLAASVRALQSRLLVALGRPQEALGAATEAMAAIRPGIELAHLIPFALAVALLANDRWAEADKYLEIAHGQLTKSLGDLPALEREKALATVPAHREVIGAWTRRRPRTAEHLLTRVGVPTGRPVAEHERLLVTWTLHTPADDDIPDPVARRRRCLARLLDEAAAQGGAPTGEDLAAAMEASVATVRRDLAALRRSGRPVPTRGARRLPTG